jgi:2-iminobutanoate/2-iminopropanoate deaminase
MKPIFFILIVTVLFACQHKQEVGAKKVILTVSAPAPIGPYSQAIVKGNMCFVAGQIAINPVTSALDTSSIEAETRLVMNNIDEILKGAGFIRSDICKTTIFLKDLSNFKTVNEIYGQFFTGEYPARETVQVAALPKGAHIEISVIAVK